LLTGDKAAELLAPAWTASGEALARDAGWLAATALDRGLEMTVRWYREGWLAMTLAPPTAAASASDPAAREHPHRSPVLP